MLRTEGQVLDGQDLPRTYLDYPELESVIIISTVYDVSLKTCASANQVLARRMLNSVSPSGDV